jgi:DNA-binding NarL/FixJ family response regulator
VYALYFNQMLQEVNSAGSPPRMRKHKLLQRLVGGLATNEGVQPERTEIWRRLKSLTPREVDVLCYVLGGQLNREIAEELGIAERTIKVHRGRVMEKLGVQSTAQLFPMVLRYIAWPAWPKFRRRRKKPKKRRPVSR